MSNVPQPSASVSALKLALAAQQQAPARQLLRAEPIAVIGLACRFPPAANTPEKFWELLRDGVDSVREVPKDRWDIDAYYDPDPGAPGKIYTRYGSFLERVDLFDPAFFGISPREATMMDPQQRLLLEVSWESLERAGIPPGSLPGTCTGVFVGMMGQDYARLSAGAMAPIDAYTGTGNLMSVAAGRVAYVLGCQGPTLTVDTACSSSLVTVHLACQSLRQAECDLALAGGVNLLLTPHHSVMQSRAHMLAPDGRCKTFDAAADGMSRGEGCGIVVLKRLADAVADGDPILAVIRGSAVNHDGRSSGLTVPNGGAQERVIRQALDGSGVRAAQVQYVEAHGSGTQLGDPIEVEALGSVYGRQRQTPLLIGSVKTNIGHLESAAGIAGLMKVILALQHREIPRHLNLKQANPHIAWSELAIGVPTLHQAWPATSGRMAGVSSFGASGTNAHVVIEEAPVLPPPVTAIPALSERPCHLAVCSARSPEALKDLARLYEHHLEVNADVNFPDLAYTSAAGRSHFSHRLSVTASSTADFRQKLADYIEDQPAAGVSAGDVPPGRPKIAFLFAGQGAQQANMGRQLYETHKGFRETIDRCDAILRRSVDWRLLDVLYPADPQPAGAGTRASLDSTAYAQPALFALEYALAKLWQSWGVEPDVVMGHSSGEYVAACIAGALSLEDGLTLIAERARLIESAASGGATAAVLAGADRVAALLSGYEGYVSIAAINGPEETLIAGAAAEVDRALKAWKAAGIDSRPLRIPHAPHSPLIESALPAFERTARTLTYHQPRIKLISNVTGGLLEDVNAEYWRRHMREPVQFAAGMRQLEASKCDVMVEIGPHPVLLWLGRQNWRGPRACWLPSLWGIRGDWEQLLESVGELYVRGVDIDWKSFYRDEARRKIALPTYPFQRQRYWVDAPAAEWQAANDPQNNTVQHALLGTRMHTVASRPDDVVFENLLSARNLAFLGDHCVHEQPVLPAAAYVEMACKALEIVLQSGSVATENVVIQQPLVLPADGAGSLVQCLVTPEQQGYRWQVYASPADRKDARWTLHAEGYSSPPRHSRERPVDAAALRTAAALEVDIDDFYRTLESRHLRYGTQFRLVRELWRGPGKALGRVSVPDELGDVPKCYRIHPALLDACLQIAAAMFLDEPETYIPVGVVRFEQISTAGAELWCEASLHNRHAEAPSVNLRIFTGDGLPVAFIDGLQLKRSDVQTPVAKDYSEWQYEVEWVPGSTASCAAPAVPVSAHGLAGSRWVVFSDAKEFGDQIAAGLAGKQASATLVDHYQAAFASEPDIDGVVFRWSEPRALDTMAEVPADLVQDESVRACAALLQVIQALVNLPRPPQLWLVTAGAVACGGSDSADPRLTVSGLVRSPLWGMAKVAALEHPELRCVRVDLDATASVEESAEALMTEIAAAQSGEFEDHVAIRGGRRYVARLARLPGHRENTPVRLRMTARGSLDRLHLEPLLRRPPNPDEVEIQVFAAGLNFRDVLNVLGMYPGDPGSFGNECAGEIAAAGENVTGFRVGDRVIALVDDAFGHYVTVSANRVVHQPPNLDFEEAATIPIAFLTAAYCLERVARVKPGERVLIHTATGGFGQAAIQLAQRANAEVFATASRDKWAVLQSLGVTHIYDSRTLDFAAEVLADTGGEGVDVVVNTLTGAGYIEKNLAVLSANGRFVEISKRDVWDPEHIAGVRPDVSYTLVDLAEMTAKQPDSVRSMLEELAHRLEKGELTALPRTCFPLAEATAAFRHMQQARHTGKIVIAPPALRGVVLREDGTYMVTGGLGGLGLLMAGWLIDRGARHVALMGRHAPSEEAQRRLEELRRSGADITVLQADVADAAQVAAALRATGAAHPLRGVIHAAGILDDGALVNQDAARFQNVLAPKVQGGWNLHVLTRDLPLDFFVLFSSVASLLGSAGQSNHAAANAFLDSLAHYRRGMGLPALAINWGAWSEIGVAAPLVAQIRRQGLGAISPEEGQQILDRLWSLPSAQAGVVPVDWARYHCASPFFAQVRPVSGHRENGVPLLEQLRAAAPGDRLALLVQQVRTHVAQILGHRNTGAISTRQGFRELGMDSLTSLELRNRLQAALNCQLPPGLVFNHPSVEAVAEYLGEHVIVRRVIAAALPSTPDTEQPATPPMRERRIGANGLNGLTLCVCEWGPDGGSPVVCLHGTRDHGGSWEAVAGPLTERGYRIVAPDFRGHGRSDHHGPQQAYNIRDFVADIDAVLRQPDLSPVTLVAHSLGSFAAVLYASAHPEQISALVLVEPPLPPEQNGHSSIGDSYSPLKSNGSNHPEILAGLDVAAGRLRQVTPAMPHTTALKMAERLTKPSGAGVVWTVDGRLDAQSDRLFAGLGREEYLGLLAALRVPIAIIYGSASGWIKPSDKERIRQAAPAARCFIVDGGHNLHLESGAQVAAIIAQAIEATPLAAAADATARASSSGEQRL